MRKRDAGIGRKTRVRRRETQLPRFGQYCERWMQTVRPGIAPSTAARYASILRCHILPLLGGRTLRQAAETAAELPSLLEARGYAPKTIRDVVGVLQKTLRFAAEESGLTPPRLVCPKRARQQPRVLTRQEQRQLTEYLETRRERQSVGILLALNTGLRVGELCALRWGDLSLAEGILRVNATLQRLPAEAESGQGRTEVQLGPPKTACSRRVIPLTARTAELCRRLGPGAPEAFVLSGSERWVEPRVMQYRLARCVAACGLERVHFHTLRHTFATRCVEAGCELKSLSEVLGHASTAVTLDLYVHATLEHKRANLEKLEALA